MTNVERLVADVIRDIGQTEVSRRYVALLAALAALIENWQQRAEQYRNLRPHDEALADTMRGCASELARLRREHGEGRHD